MADTTAREFILGTLRLHPDRELRVADLSDLCGGRYTRNNMQETLGRLLALGMVSKTIDDDRTVWWGIATEPRGRPTLALVDPGRR